MRDNLRPYRAIRNALIQGYPGEPKGRCARHLTTLAALISGIVASKSPQLPKVAARVPDGNQPESRVKPRRAPAFGAARHWRFAGGVLTPPLTKGMLTPPWNPSTRFPPGSR